MADKGKKNSLVSVAVNLLSHLFFLYILSSVSAQLSDDRKILLELKKSISDPYGILNSWNANSFNHCSWFGISCNSDFRVSELRIGGNFSLSHSCSLNSELGLHDFGTRRNCSVSFVINGRLGGRISSVIEKLTDLRVLSLPFNEFDGEIPVEIWGLKNLEVLDLEGNLFSGCFSGYDLSGLKKLRVLNLAFNRISGRFPHSLSKCRGLKILKLAGNRINDVIPGFVGHFRKLRVVNLSFNRLVGYIPNDLGYDCGNLEHLDLSANSLNGEIPRALGNCGRLRTLLLSSNALRGVIPNELGKLQSLEALDVSRNRLSGPLPANLGNCTRLSVLVLSTHFNVHPLCPRGGALLDDHNSFEGPIPYEITTLPELKIMWAPSANFEGNFPSKWGSCKSLMMVNLAQNHFTGEVSGLFTGCTELKYLNLSSNKLTGTLDGNLQLFCIPTFNIGGNLLFGPVPDFDASVCHHLPSTGVQHVSSDDPSVAYFSFFSHELLSETACPFSSTRPSVICDFSGEQVPIPPFTRDGGEEEIEYIFLAGGNNGGSLAFNMSKNSVTDSIPWDGPSADNSKDKSHGRNVLILACVIVGPAVIAVSLILVGYFCIMKRGGEISTTEIPVTPPLRRVTLFEDVGVPLTYDNIVEATDNFSQRNCIGNGGFGFTYKAELASGNIVAVKRLGAERHQGVAQFHAEISTLGRVRHPNLITLIGYYAKDSEMFLIYNFLPGGNLDRFIRDRASRAFNFDVMHKIALHIASALSFLHEQSTPRILHRDVKPSNILLDGENNAFLSDFGLSKILAPNETHVTARVAGTYGYIAPEYALTGCVSNKCDVYSYGVVLLELMSDKRVLDPSFFLHEDGFSIVSWALMLLNQGQAKDVFTASLWEEGPRDKLVKMLHVAILCTLETVTARPSMRQVVQRLKELQHPPS